MPSLYIVRDRTFCTVNGGSPPLIRPVRYRAAFPNHPAAEQHRQELERQARREGGIWVLYDATYEGAEPWPWLLEQTEFAEPVFRDWLADADIPPLPLSRWDEETDTDPLWTWIDELTPEQRVHLVAGLHHLEFYEICEVELIDGAYPPKEWEPWEHATPPPMMENGPPSANLGEIAEPDSGPPSDFGDDIPF